MSGWNTYILVIKVGEQVELSIRGRVVGVEPGLYLYVGSAKGRGGALPRIVRHISRVKKKRWHIDYLTMERRVNILGFFLIQSIRGDCESTLSRLLAMEYPYIPGFGSSDKPSDPSHLFICRSGVLDCIIGVYSIVEKADCAGELVFVDNGALL